MREGCYERLSSRSGRLEGVCLESLYEKAQTLRIYITNMIVDLLYMKTLIKHQCARHCLQGGRKWTHKQIIKHKRSPNGNAWSRCTMGGL